MERRQKSVKRCALCKLNETLEESEREKNMHLGQISCFNNLKVVFIVKSRQAMLVKEEIQHYCGDKHFIHYASKIKHKFSLGGGDLVADQD